MKDITEIVEDLVNSLDFTFVADLSTFDNDNFLLTTKNTYWLTLGQKITINIAGQDYVYKIVSLKINEYIILKPTLQGTPQPPEGELFAIPKPTYRHGTAMAINEELSTLQDDDKRLFFWLYGVNGETFAEAIDSSIERITPIRVFIFAESYPEQWTTEDHYTNVIRPLSQLFLAFRNAIKNNESLFTDIQDFEQIYLPNWVEFNLLGSSSANKSFEARIFDEDWSGIEGRTTLNIKNQRDCFI